MVYSSMSLKIYVCFADDCVLYTTWKDWTEVHDKLQRNIDISMDPHVGACPGHITNIFLKLGLCYIFWSYVLRILIIHSELGLSCNTARQV